jgi:acyl carrier protein
MTLTEFVEAFAGEFDETPASEFTPDTDFKSLEEWSSLTALSIIAVVEDEMEKTVTGADLRSCKTIEDLYNLVLTK